MKAPISGIKLVAIICSVVISITVKAAELRRPISNSQPAWIIHIDVWNNADPQKIIDMVPEDVRPFVIFNIATSSNDELSADGPAIYDSWMKVCAQNRVWTMIQCASGAANRMPETPDNVSDYEKYYKEYPNFLGFNFAEQYWGFDESGGVSFDDRLKLFAKLLSLAKTYGGYLAVSFADSYHNANKMPVAYMNRNSDINSFLTSSPEHFLCFEKYTQKKHFLYNESHCLGAWLSGFAGQYGIRFDSSGWIGNGQKPDANDGDTQYTIGTSDFVRAAGAIPVAEHMMLTGQTIMDGPELSWTECSKESSPTTADGFTRRNWEWMPQWNAITLDLFRKVLDGTIRIPSKAEVMNRTKICVVSNGNNDNNETYRIPTALYDGLYRNEKDYGGLQEREANHWLNNRWWMKSTGRYPTIPNMLNANGLTDISSSVNSQETKINTLNEIFPAEYTGDIFAGRLENGWVTYNPYQYHDETDNGVRTLSASTQQAVGNIPFQYNTCESVDLEYAPYSLGIMNEYADKVTFYLQNYEGGTDVIKINGATSEPTYTASSGSITKTWVDNVLTLEITHSGSAVELTINCSGSATDRKTSYTTASITTPAAPEVYTGILQYEAELADYKSASIQKSGYNKNHDGYKGQGFAEMTSSSSALRYYVNVPTAGYYLLTLRYQSENAGSMSLSASGETRTMNLTANTEWGETHMPVKLSAGVQTIDLTNAGGQTTYVDCIQLEKQTIAQFNYDTLGEFHVDLSYLSASGDVTFNASTGEVSVPAKKAGSLTLLLDAADFSRVANITLSKTGGDVFNYFSITDVDGNSVNSGNFWSSKYNLNYNDYKSKDASKQVYKLEWTANYSNETDQTMTINDILVMVTVDNPSKVINESESIPTVIPQNVTSADITYSRTLEAPASGSGDVTIKNQEAKLYTVCLPYKPTVSNGMKYYTLQGEDNGSLVFVEVSTVSANTPYLVAVTGGSYNIGNGTSASVNFNAPVIDSENLNGFQLKGTLRGLTNSEAQGFYILQPGNVWGQVTTTKADIYIPPFRAYIVASAPAAGTRLRSTIDEGKGTTAINHIQTQDADGTVRWYDLNGRQIARPTQKGIYIKNGKKVILK